jgi:hypothetical protein
MFVIEFLMLSIVLFELNNKFSPLRIIAAPASRHFKYLLFRASPSDSIFSSTSADVTSLQYFHQK